MVVDVMSRRREEFEVLVQTILEQLLMSGQPADPVREQCRLTYCSVEFCQAIRGRKMYLY